MTGMMLLAILPPNEKNCEALMEPVFYELRSCELQGVKVEVEESSASSSSSSSLPSPVITSKETTAHVVVLDVENDLRGTPKVSFSLLSFRLSLTSASVRKPLNFAPGKFATWGCIRPTPRTPVFLPLSKNAACLLPSRQHALLKSDDFEK